MRIEPLLYLNPAIEILLRERDENKGREPTNSPRQIGEALAARKVEAAILYDDASMPRGIAAWRWTDRAQSYAQVVMLYTPRSAPAALGQALADYVFSELTRIGSLQVIEVRLRDESPGAREAWQRHGLVDFERWQMKRSLSVTPLPIVPVPDDYLLAPWREEYDTEIEQVAAAAYKAGIEPVAVPDPQGNRVVENLRKLRAGRVGEQADASLLILDKDAHSVAGYIAALKVNGEAQVDDLAVHPSHRRRGLARLLLVRCMTIAQRQGQSAVTLTVTARNPVCTLYNQLGFHPINCGEVGIWWRDGRQLSWRA